MRIRSTLLREQVHSKPLFYISTLYLLVILLIVKIIKLQLVFIKEGQIKATTNFGNIKEDISLIIQNYVEDLNNKEGPLLMIEDINTLVEHWFEINNIQMFLENIQLEGINQMSLLTLALYEENPSIIILAGFLLLFGIIAVISLVKKIKKNDGSLK